MVKELKDEENLNEELVVCRDGDYSTSKANETTSPFVI